MFTLIEFWHILAAGLVGYVIAMIWYSPILFVKPWMRGVGKTEADLVASKKEMPRTLAYSFVISCAIAFGLSTFLNLLDVHTLLEALQITLLIGFSFIITAKFSDMLHASREPHWSKVPQQLFLVEAGFSIASLSAMATVLMLLR